MKTANTNYAFRGENAQTHTHGNTKTFDMPHSLAVWLYRGVNALGNPVAGELHLYADNKTSENTQRGNKVGYALMVTYRVNE